MLEVIFRYHCRFCAKCHQEKHRVYGEMPRPANAPEGWTNLNNDYICPDHQIVVRETVERPL